MGKQITVFSRFQQKIFQTHCFHLHLEYHVLFFSRFTLSQAPCFIDMLSFPEKRLAWAYPFQQAGSPGPPTSSA